MTPAPRPMPLGALSALCVAMAAVLFTLWLGMTA
jgi:hypothetical protein